MPKLNQDEVHICDIANSLDGVSARLATPEEDCGHQKADVVIFSKGLIYYLQVSHTPKSKKERERLSVRGTTPISTHRYSNIPYSNNELKQKITQIIDYSVYN